jgi:cysteine desulfurase/selenocysteine lyase
LAFSFGEAFINAGDEIIVSESEHHSNIVPWQMLCERKKAVLKVLPLKFSGEWNLVALNSLVNEKTKLIAVSHISNSLGTINPIEEIINYAHARNIPVMIDGAQGIQHQMVDVQALDCDFYVFSGHKIYGPTGIGILYGKESWLEKLPPYKGGGDMIKTVTFEKTIYNDLPFKFEAGTTNFIGAVGLATALKYLDEKGDKIY